MRTPILARLRFLLCVGFSEAIAQREFHHARPSQRLRHFEVLSNPRFQGYGTRNETECDESFFARQLVRNRFVRMRRGRAAAYSGYGPDYYPLRAWLLTLRRCSGRNRRGTSPADCHANAIRKPLEVSRVLGDGIAWRSLGTAYKLWTDGDCRRIQRTAVSKGQRACSLCSTPAAERTPARSSCISRWASGRSGEIHNCGHNYMDQDGLWSTGSWTRKIPIAELNIDATQSVNQKRGAEFRLPHRQRSR